MNFKGIDARWVDRACPSRAYCNGGGDNPVTQTYAAVETDSGETVGGDGVGLVQVKQNTDTIHPQEALVTPLLIDVSLENCQAQG